MEVLLLSKDHQVTKRQLYVICSRNPPIFACTKCLSCQNHCWIDENDIKWHLFCSCSHKTVLYFTKKWPLLYFTCHTFQCSKVIIGVISTFVHQVIRSWYLAVTGTQMLFRCLPALRTHKSLMLESDVCKNCIKYSKLMMFLNHYSARNAIIWQQYLVFVGVDSQNDWFKFPTAHDFDSQWKRGVSRQNKVLISPSWISSDGPKFHDVAGFWVHGVVHQRGMPGQILN